MKLLEEHRRLVRSLLPKHNGIEIKTMGDAFLVEFVSALEAVRCAFAIQETLHEVNSGRPAERRILIRIGIHSGDVIHTQADVYGDAVNVASRIESLAIPGGICMSEEVYRQIKNKFEFPLASLGERSLKNVGEPMGVYSVMFPWEREDVIGTVPDSRRLAVLPFVNISPDPSDDYFADGMTEELIDRLSQIKELKVIARTSSMAYKKKEMKASAIGKELAVGTLVEGSVRKAGNKVRVTVQLVASETEEHLWSSRYDRDLSDIFVIQSEIAESVANELRVKLVDPTKRALSTQPTGSTEAYTLYLKGRYYWNERTEEGLKKAVDCFQKAIDLDPSFARAYSGLADSYNVIQTLSPLKGFHGLFSPREALAKARQLAEKALEIDGSLAEAFCSLGSVHGDLYEWDKSESNFRKALELKPSYATAHFWYGIILNWLGRNEEAIEHSRQAEELDPLSPAVSVALGQTLINSGRSREAISHLEAQLRVAPDVGPLVYMLGFAYYCDKRYADAAEMAKKAIAMDGRDRRYIALLGAALAKLGRGPEAEELLSELKGRYSGIATAMVYAALGQKEKALESLQGGFHERTTGLGWIAVVPWASELRSDPRFVEMLQEMHLA